MKGQKKRDPEAEPEQERMSRAAQEEEEDEYAGCTRENPPP